MDEKINIAKILKNKPEGTKLWTDMFGSVTLYVVTDACDAFQVKHHNKEPWFDKDGKLCKEGVLCIYPSKLMRDWRKFAWKKGDVLKNTAYEERVIFDGFLNDDYTYFKGKHPLDCSNKLNITYYEECNCFTGNYRLESEDAAQTYIKTIEEKLGGKLNRETLKIEKAQPEFKDGDIVHDVHGYNTYIIKEFSNKHIKIYAGLTKQYGALLHKIGISEIFHLRLATEEEKQQLFDALAKEGKAWDAEKKEVVDLKPKCEFKPMDLCLMKYIGRYNNRGWELCQYAYTEHRVSPSGEQRDFYHSVGGEIYAECIPYNEDTKHLLGTRDKWKGGEQ